MKASGTRLHPASRSSQAADHTSGLGPGVLAVFQHLGPVDEHVVDTGRELGWLCEGRVIRNGRRIKDDDVRIISRFQ
jgi:hypothetical protein